MADVIEALALRARKILQLQKESGAQIDRESIAKLVALDGPIFSLTTGQTIGPEEIEAATRVLWTIFVTEQGPALVLQDKENARPAPWYVGDRRQPGPFMQRYINKLEEDRWPEDSITELKESTAKILESMDDPQRMGSWDWRGLVVGDVQSGKTASYAGVVNRAADAGYRIIIILAGMHNILRLQTQKRFDQDFLGYDTNPKSQEPNQPMPVVGVAAFNAQLVVDSLTAASLKGDFSQTVADQANFSPVSQPCVLVVKKNAKVLENLNNWIARRSAPSRAAPVLVIDDESDQASVDTGDQPLLEDGTFDEDYDPKRVNGEIRKLLMKFDRRVYVGYTATPFANIFIHDERKAKDYGPDLFPSTFIVSLTPPDDYFGPAAVFGTNDEADNPRLPLVRPLDQTGEKWIPEKHDKTLKPRFNGQDVIPPSLEKAIDTFLLTCAARVARGQGREHNSMLVHVSRYVDVHIEVHRQVEKYLIETRAMISNGDRETLQRLKNMWDEDYVPTTAAVEQTIHGRNTIRVTWDQVRAQLADSCDKIEVITANGKSKADIDYDAYKETGRSLIAIGGDKLSRGLTLEGLQLADFSAGDPFHQQVETLANNTWLDDGKGRWFYERARGSYIAAEQKAAYRKPDQKAFRSQTPKSRRFSKLDVARYLSAWAGLPYRVCLGGQKNFQHFMQRMKDNPLPPPDTAWFNRLIATAILYRAVEKKIRSMKFPAYAAQITAYLVAAIAQKTGGRIDFDRLWSRQIVSPEMDHLVEVWAPQIEATLRRSAGQRNPSEWFKKEDCWKDIQGHLPALKEPLPPELSYSGAGQFANPVAPSTSLSVADYEKIERCMKIKSSTWMEVAELGLKAGLFHWKVAGICRTLAGSAAGGWDRKPSAKQAKPALEALRAAEEAKIVKIEALSDA